MGRRRSTWLCIRVRRVLISEPTAALILFLSSFGLLHRIPVDRQQEQSPGGQEQFPEYEEQELHAPTSMPGGHHGIGAEYIGQGQSRHSQDSGASQHHHHHDNGLNHNHRRLDGPPSFNKTSFDQETPRRTTLTPTQSLSFGNLMNGDSSPQ